MIKTLRVGGMIKVQGIVFEVIQVADKFNATAFGRKWSSSDFDTLDELKASMTGHVILS